MSLRARRFVGLLAIVALISSACTNEEESKPTVSVLEQYWERTNKTWNVGKLETLWSGPPLTEPRGMVVIGDWAYITDNKEVEKGSGRRQAQNSVIYRMPITGSGGEPQLFFESEEIINSKYLATLPDKKGFVVTDFGQLIPGKFDSSGVGAKVAKITLTPDGSFGEFKVLWEGAPLVGPQGLDIVGNYAIVADTQAGPQRTRPEAPDAPFTSGAIFAIPLDGGEPIKLWEGDPFVTLIGITRISDKAFYALDIHSNRVNKVAGFFPYSGGSDYWKFTITSESPLKVSKPERIELTEEGPLTFVVRDVDESHRLRLELQGGATFAGAGSRLTLEAAGLKQGKELVRRELIEVPMTETTIRLKASVLGRRDSVVASRSFSIPKDPNQIMQLVDNKHAASGKGCGGITSASATESGTTSSSDVNIEIICLASADPTGGGQYIIPVGGGTPIQIAAGSGLVHPICDEFTEDGRYLIIDDQDAGPNKSGAVFKLAFPSREEIAKRVRRS